MAHHDQHHLPPVETALLLAMRAWLAARRRGLPDSPETGAVLEMLGCREAVAPLGSMMMALAMPAGAFRPIVIRCLCDRSVSADEKRLLHVIALQQQARSLESMILLRSILRDEAAMAVQCAASVLAQVLTWADQRLLAPETAMRLEVLATDSASNPRQAATMH